MTPYELKIIFDGYSELLTERRQELLYLAWHIEAFARQKRLPALKKVLKDCGLKKTQKKLSMEQLFVIAKSKGLIMPERRR